MKSYGAKKPSGHGSVMVGSSWASTWVRVRVRIKVRVRVRFRIRIRISIRIRVWVWVWVWVHLHERGEVRVVALG